MPTATEGEPKPPVAAVLSSALSKAAEIGLTADNAP